MVSTTRPVLSRKHLLWHFMKSQVVTSFQLNLKRN